MTAQLIVLLRYILTMLFAALGGFLTARGVLTEGQAATLMDPEFIGAAASFTAAVFVYLYYLLFSDASRALAAWTEWTEAMREPRE